MRSRLPTLVALIPLAGGCFLGRDDSGLTSRRDGSAADAADAGDGPDATGRCVPLDGVAPGSLPAGMQVELGAWAVADEPVLGRRALVQSTAPSGDTLYRILTDDPDVADVTIAATLVVGADPVPGDPKHQCVMVRYLDKDNFYWLGIDSNADRWQLKRKVAGVSDALLLMPLVAPVGSQRRLELTARGTRLEVRIDGVLAGSIDDDGLTHGRVGLATGTDTRYADVCVTAPPR